MLNSNRPAIAPTRKKPAAKAAAGFHCPLELHSLPHRHSRSAKLWFIMGQHSVSRSPGAPVLNSKHPAIAPTRELTAPKAVGSFHCPLELHSLPHRHSCSVIALLGKGATLCISVSRSPAAKFETSRFCAHSKAASTESCSWFSVSLGTAFAAAQTFVLCNSFAW